MKKSIKFLLVILVSHYTYSQSTLTIGEDYVFKSTTRIYPYDIKTKKVDSLVSVIELSPVGGKFEIIDEIKGFYIIKFYLWNVARKSNSKDNSFYRNQVYKASTYNYLKLDTIIKPTSKFKRFITLTAATKNKTIPLINDNNFKYFAVEKENFDKKCVSTDEYSRWNATSGALVMPLKLRTQTGDFTKDISVNGIVAIGYKLNKNNILNVIGGIGIASVNLDSLNTEGKIIKASDRSALSFCVGPLYQ